jgi:glycosyltransferase involved in cell wall biosynthesis
MRWNDHPLPGPDPVYLEVYPLLLRHLTGIGRFVARLVESLSRLRPLRLVNTIQGEHAESMRLSKALPCGYEIAVSAADLPPADEDVGTWARRLMRRPRRRHDRYLAEKSPGVYTLLRPPHRHFRRELCILYDFTPLLMPQAHVPETLEYFGPFFGDVAGRSDKAVAISAATKADAGWLSNLAAEDVVVGYPGPSLCVRQHAYTGPVARRENVILVVSTLEPRKNGPFLLDWFLKTAALSRDAELWWVGPNGWMCDLARPGLRHRFRGRQVRFLGMVPDRRLCELYRQAAFTIYPSLYEGFGFPVLDSLRHETPVVCSFNSSLQEFAGPGVYYFDACDPDSLDEACRALRAGSPGSVRRPDLDERFSWDALGRTVVGLL